MYENSSLGFDKLEFDYIEAYERTDGILNNDDLVYGIFKEMLEDGILWTDPSAENIGKLVKSNIYFHEKTGYNDDKFYIDDEYVGIFESFNDRKVLDKGEIIIHDVDTLYYFGKALYEYIKNKVISGENISFYNLIEVYDMNNVVIGPSFEVFLDRYVGELKK